MIVYINKKALQDLLDKEPKLVVVQNKLILDEKIIDMSASDLIPCELKPLIMPIKDELTTVQ